MALVRIGAVGLQQREFDAPLLFQALEGNTREMWMVAAEQLPRDSLSVPEEHLVGESQVPRQLTEDPAVRTALARRRNDGFGPLQVVVPVRGVSRPLSFPEERHADSGAGGVGTPHA